METIAAILLFIVSEHPEWTYGTGEFTLFLVFYQLLASQLLGCVFAVAAGR